MTFHNHFCLFLPWLLVEEHMSFLRCVVVVVKKTKHGRVWPDVSFSSPDFWAWKCFCLKCCWCCCCCFKGGRVVSGRRDHLTWPDVAFSSPVFVAASGRVVRRRRFAKLQVWIVALGGVYVINIRKIILRLIWWYFSVAKMIHKNIIK